MAKTAQFNIHADAGRAAAKARACASVAPRPVGRSARPGERLRQEGTKTRQNAATLNVHVSGAPMDRNWSRQELAEHWSLGLDLRSATLGSTCSPHQGLASIIAPVDHIVRPPLQRSIADRWSKRNSLTVAREKA